MENEETFSYEEFYDFYNKLPVEDQNLFFGVIVCTKKFGDKFSKEFNSAIESKDIETIRQTVRKWTSRIRVDELATILNMKDEEK